MKRMRNIMLLLAAAAGTTWAGNVDFHRLAPVSIQQVTLDDEFWSPKFKVWREVTLPDCLLKFEKDGALVHFDKVRDGKGGEHAGPAWYDGLVYEMIRGCADFLAAQRDAALEARLEAPCMPSTAAPGATPSEFTAIPYFATANRQPGEMAVWIPESADKAEPLPSSAMASQAQEARIEVRTGKPLHGVSRFLTGACIEDVNHEVYGGIDSQMVYGESFAEPAPPPPLSGFKAYGGRWMAKDGELNGPAGDGPKLVSDAPAFAEGEASVELWFAERKRGNAGLVVKVSQPGMGADNFIGYEVALETSGRLVLGRHRRNWETIRNVPCEVPINQWIPMTVRMTAKTLEILVNGKSVTLYEDSEHALESGAVGLRTWQREARFRNMSVTSGGARTKLAFAAAAPDWRDGVSGMWRPMACGRVQGEFKIEEQNACSGRQSQRLTFKGGEGEIGIENQGLNRWGMNFIRGKSYEGFVCVRADLGTEFFVALESRDGSMVYAEKRFMAKAGDWQRLNFKLKADMAAAGDKTGRFALKLKKPGSIAVGYAFLQPGEWGRFKGQPVRRDVAEGLISQGITVLRQGGSMVNAAEYRWKKMVGPRERRPPYSGWWYPHSSNGWGIFEFLNFCEAAGFLGIPDVNMGETPQDMADFIEYANGPASSAWGRRRAADGHRAPYHLKYLEMGNEERVDENYADKFEALAKAIWSKDPEIILVVGDFAYTKPIPDPFHLEGAVSGITNLSAQKRILQLARQHNREVWFDVHVGTEGPMPDEALAGMFSFRDALDKIAEGARHQVVVFEFNAGHHSQRRALANALAIQAIERDGRIPIATSANCLQPDGQNDNDWDQGLLFLNPSMVWLQPPGWVTQMFSRHYLPSLVECAVNDNACMLDVNAKQSADGRKLALQVVNPTDKAIAAKIHLSGFVPRNPMANVTVLAGALEERNTADHPGAIVPRSRPWRHELDKGDATFTFLPYSVNVIAFE